MKRTIFRLQLIVALLLSLSPLASASDTARHAILSRMFTTGDYFGFPGETSAPFTCNSTVERSTYYDTTAHSGYICNGTSWISTSGPTLPLSVANGGTGLTSGTSGGILGFTASGTLASSAALTANAIVLGGGAGATPTVLGSLGSTTTVLHGAAGAPTFGAVALGTDVSGQLPLANGGTNATLTASNGGIFYSTGSAGAILAGTATAGQALLSGSSTTPAWTTVTFPSTAANNTTLVSNGTAFSAAALPACTDSGGNHLNYSSGSFSCGTSSSSSAFSGITSGTNTAAAMVVGSGAAFSFVDNVPLGIGTAGAAGLYRSGTPTNKYMEILTDHSGRNTLVIQSDAQKDLDLSLGAASTPTLYVTDGSATTTHWASLTHNGADGVIAVGLGGILTPQNIKTSTPDFFFLTNTSTHSFRVASTSKYVGVGSDYAYAFTGSAGDANTAPDTELNRPVAGVVKVTDGSGSTNGWLAQPAAYGYVTADYTNATAGLTNITTTSVTLKASRIYNFKATLQVDNSTAADGVLIDFNGGSATATNFIGFCEIINNSSVGATTQLTALNGTCSEATLTSHGLIRVEGTIEVNGAGTFIVRASENAHTTGTLTVHRGSVLLMTDLSS